MQKDRPNESAGPIAHEADGIRFAAPSVSTPQGVCLRHPRVFSSRRVPMQKDRPNESAGHNAHEADGIRTRNHRIDSPGL